MIAGTTQPSPDRRDRPVVLEVGGEPPTFCPRCRVDGLLDQALCPECGEAVILRGYCWTCEAFWKRPVAAPCPKHDVPLEAAPPPGKRQNNR